MSKITSTTIINPQGKEDASALVQVTGAELYFLLQPITSLGKYVISFYVKAQANKTLVVHYGEQNKSFNVTTEWQRVVFNFTAEHIDNVMIQFTTGNYYIYNTKLENGDVATDYTLSPDDLQEQLNAIETSMSLKYSEVLQTLDEYQITVGQVTSDLDGRLEKAEASLELKVGVDDNDRIVSMINASADEVKIEADKIDLIGKVTAEMLTTDAIMSKNYIVNESGSFLNLEDGAFDSKYLKWREDGYLDATGGQLAQFVFDNTTMICEVDGDVEDAFIQYTASWRSTEEGVTGNIYHGRETKFSPRGLSVFYSEDMSYTDGEYIGTYSYNRWTRNFDLRNNGIVWDASFFMDDAQVDYNKASVEFVPGNGIPIAGVNPSAYLYIQAPLVKIDAPVQATNFITTNGISLEDLYNQVATLQTQLNMQEEQI